MKKNKLLVIVLLAALSGMQAQTPLFIPPVITGTNINLTLQEGTTTFYSGITTNTMGANGSLLGPTLILNTGDPVNIIVDNQLTETTTIHWHGMHVSPENDGGPHSTILPGNTWNPQFTVMDKAGTYWYHPHLHMKTDRHVSKGIAGMILVRDTEEAALNLPMNYGVDEFPIVMQTKGFDSIGQIEVHTEMDTSVMVNGTINATVDMPAQVVRLRVLNGSSQRTYELGFSDDRTFSLIGTDGGLFTAPVNLSRYRISPGQRADILVDLSADLGQNLQLINYSSELPNAIYGAAQPGMAAFMVIPNYLDNPLNGSDFQVLDINVVAQTSSPVLTIPATLANYTMLTEGTEDATRTLTFSSVAGGPDIVGPFQINNTVFDMSVINETIPLDNIEIWTLTNATPIAHPFHIHDVQFAILDINGNPPPPELQGFNDVVLVPGGQGTVRFITLFNDFASDTVPFMYHCHMLTHEDMGMMGQFLVVDATGVEEQVSNDDVFNVFPNPSRSGNFVIDLSDMNDTPIFYEIYSIEGKLIEKKNITQSKFEVSIKNMSGIYLLNIHSESSVSTQKLIVE